MYVYFFCTKLSFVGPYYYKMATISDHICLWIVEPGSVRKSMKENYTHPPNTNLQKKSYKIYVKRQ